MARASVGQFAKGADGLHINMYGRSFWKRLRPERSEVFRLWCDNRKMRELTGFQPMNDLRSGLRATIGWFLAPGNLAKYKTDIYNV